MPLRMAVDDMMCCSPSTGDVVTHPLTYKYLLRTWRDLSMAKIQRVRGVVGNMAT